MEMVETEYSVYVVLENGDEDGDGSDATYNEAQSHAKRTAQASNLPTVVYEEKWLGDRRVSFNPIYRHAKPYQR